MESNPSFNDFVTCPYDKTHSVLRGRLTKHMIRCSRNADDGCKKLLVCPFNEDHRFNAKELKLHIENCSERISLERIMVQRDNLPKEAGVISTTIQCEDDWDKEPDVPSYDPTKYCEENLVIRKNPYVGQSKSVRKEIREKERRRFAEMQ